MKQLIPINKRQTEILIFLYRFRFLTRLQIQNLLTHKSHSKIVVWLNQMLKPKLVSKHQSSSTVTAYYSLGTIGRKYLITQKLVKKTLPLNRIWREASYSITFREKCGFIATLYLQLATQWGGALRFWTKTDLAGISHVIAPAPDAYIVINQKSEADRFFVEVPSTPRTKNIIDHIERYSEYYYSNEWQDKISKEFPTVILLCTNISTVKTARRYIKENYADESDLHFVISSDRTLEKILPKKKARGD